MSNSPEMGLLIGRLFLHQADQLPDRVTDFFVDTFVVDRLTCDRLLAHLSEGRHPTPATANNLPFMEAYSK